MTEADEPDAEVAGPVIGELIAEELTRIRSVGLLIQSRGITVISTAGTLATLLFGLSALATKAQNFVLPVSVKIPLCLAAAFLVGATLAGIATNAPRRSDALALSSLATHLTLEWWNAPKFEAEREVARTRLKVAQRARRLNTLLARFLLCAIFLELVGVACVAWAVVALVVTA